MLKKLIRYWDYLWRGVVGFSVLVALILGIINTYDRFQPKESTRPDLQEYIFGSPYYFVQALVDQEDKVLAYGITSRQRDFNPKITILENLFYIKQDKIDFSNTDVDFSEATPGKKTIILGKTTFADIGDSPENIVFANDNRGVYYHEEYYYGNSANYQSYFFALNYSGYIPDKNDFSPLFEYRDTHVNTEDLIIKEFRKNTIVNTFFVTAPLVGLDNLEIRRYMAGPNYTQVRVIPNTAMDQKEDMETQKTKLTKLATEVNIKHFINVLGDPLVINNTPEFSLEYNPTLKEQWGWNEKLK